MMLQIVRIESVIFRLKSQKRIYLKLVSPVVQILVIMKRLLLRYY